MGADFQHHAEFGYTSKSHRFGSVFPVSGGICLDKETHIAEIVLTSRSYSYSFSYSYSLLEILKGE